MIVVRFSTIIKKKIRNHSPSALSRRGLGGILKLAHVHDWKRTKTRIEINAAVILPRHCSTILHWSYSDAASPWTFITLENKRRVVSESVYVVETLASDDGKSITSVQKHSSDALRVNARKSKFRTCLAGHDLKELQYLWMNVKSTSCFVVKSKTSMK